MSRYGAVLDACVLAPMPLADTLLRLAEQGFFRPFWSEQILDETARTLGKFGQPPSLIQRRVDVLGAYFPEAIVADIGSVVLSPGLPDPEDDHVLEAAIRSGAQAIVTLNLKHFPADICSRHYIDVLSPDDFLVNQFDLDPDLACRTLIEQVNDLKRPAVTLLALLQGLRRDAPNFADRVAHQLL